MEPDTLADHVNIGVGFQVPHLAPVNGDFAQPIALKVTLEPVERTKWPVSFSPLVMVRVSGPGLGA